MKILSVSFFLALLLATIPAFALDFDFSGTFEQDNEVLLFDFTVGSLSDVTVFSSSWDDGGFDPILAIWDSTGTRIAQQDDGGATGTAVSNNVTYDYGTWDTFFTTQLLTGSYTASIAQYNNFSVSLDLADGFVFDAVPDFTSSFGPAAFFNGVWGGYNSETELYDDPRTGDWAFHILNVAEAVIVDDEIVDDVAPVPEPSTLLLLGSGLVGLFWYGRKRKKV